jgi:hypothetical protein
VLLYSDRESPIDFNDNAAKMTDEDKTLVNKLCKRVVEEQDPVVFTTLVAQLNDLLERKEQKSEADSN